MVSAVQLPVGGPVQASHHLAPVGEWGVRGPEYCGFAWSAYWRCGLISPICVCGSRGSRRALAGHCAFGFRKAFGRPDRFPAGRGSGMRTRILEALGWNRLGWTAWGRGFSFGFIFCASALFITLAFFFFHIFY